MTLHPDRWNPTLTTRKLGVVVHDSESGDGSHDALVAILAQPKVLLPNGTYNVAGYHAVTDGKGDYTLVADASMGPFAAPPTNPTWWHVCMPGRAAQTRDEWLDDLSRNHIRGVARFIVDHWHADSHTWPLELRSPAELVAGAKGYTSHNNVSFAWHKTTHTDPGPSFPWDVLAADIAALTKPAPLEEDEMPIITNFEQLYDSAPGVAKFALMDDGRLRHLEYDEWVARGSKPGTAWSNAQIAKAGLYKAAA